MKEYTEAKDLEAKYKAHSLKKRKTTRCGDKRFKQDAANFQSQAQANGQAWAQQKRSRIAKKSNN
jgi:outer membrane protein